MNDPDQIREFTTEDAARIVARSRKAMAIDAQVREIAEAIEALEAEDLERGRMLTLLASGDR